MTDSSPLTLSAEQRALVAWTLRVPRGRYPAWRASQLSGVPRSTLYDWVRNEVFVPDFQGPLEWSYRDLIFVRLVAWLRSKGMPRPEVAQRVRVAQRRLADAANVEVLRSDGRAVFFGEETADEFSGQQAIPSVLSFLDEFQLVAPMEGDEFGRRRRMWGPNLLVPSTRSYISPRVMGGEPCVTDTRIPTGTLFALHTQRGLAVGDIRALYEELTPSDVADALSLESRLRREPLAA